MVKVLLVATSADHLGTHPTGTWLEEVSAPYYIWKDAGFQVDVASVQGGKIPVDAKSLENMPEVAVRFQQDSNAMSALDNPLALVSVQLDSYDAIFFPGGHGTVVDLPNNPLVSKAVETIWKKGGYVTAVCHGPNALVGPVNDDGTPLVAGKKVSVFTDEEERAVGLENAVPFLVESKLRELGADIQKGPVWLPFAVADGKLITGQNPASSADVAQLLVKKIQESA
eukprot:GILJ01009616.1.p1 GENE.GILJ01009616.1~~GILJ01009616.1.p1  ORF type:complete len:226 (-),score=37.42 GILJ01009616.1:109-786(-)